jgi:hypothetical protein
MSISESLHHILRLTLFWVRRESRQNKQETLLESRDSVVTPLGQLGYRRVNTGVNLEDGIERARKREYATRPCKRLEE